jgi:hypothetical protein
VAIEGPLKELGLHDIFQLLDLSRKTGVMRVTSHLRNNDGLVAFDGGAIVHAAIRSNPHRIGEMLVNAGRITAADLERARAIQDKETDRRLLGQILIGLGALAERDLERVIEAHITEVVLELLSWQEGFFSFAEGSLASVPRHARVRIRTESLLMEGARRIDEWSRIEAHIPHLGVVPMLAAVGDGDLPAQLDLLPGEWEVLAYVDGERDVRRIAQGLGRSDFEVARTLFGLVTTGICVLHDVVAARTARTSAGADAAALVTAAELRLESGDLTAAREAAHAAAALRPGEPRVHLVLARAHLREGRVMDAVDEARRAARLAPEHFEAHRLFGLALAAAGRFREADEQWAQCERLLVGGDPSPGARGELAAARGAAATLDAMLETARGR